MNKVVHYKFPLIAKGRQELLLISWICSSFNLVDYFCPAWLIIFLLLWIYLYAVCESTRYKWTSWKREMKVTYTIVVRLIPDIWESIFFFLQYFIDDTDPLWERHCCREFKGTKPKSGQSWRELYMVSIVLLHYSSYKPNSYSVSFLHWFHLHGDTSLWVSHH